MTLPQAGRAKAWHLTAAVASVRFGAWFILSSGCHAAHHRLPRRTGIAAERKRPSTGSPVLGRSALS